MRPTSIIIPQPCAASWSAMVPDGTGRHCASCQNVVVDFSRKSTAEVLAYLAQPSHENTCGRFRAGQLRQSCRFHTWRAAPGLALAVVAVLTLTHCSPDQPAATPLEKPAVAVLDGQLVRGRVLDRDSRKPLVGAIVICEADTQCRTRTAADGSFALVVPHRLANSKLIAGLAEPAVAEEQDKEWQMPYIPHFFTAGPDVTVLLRRPPMMLGQTRLEPDETFSPAIHHYLGREWAAPPPPKLTTIKFTPPAGSHTD